jgi:hypothetical protein
VCKLLHFGHRYASHLPGVSISFFCTIAPIQARRSHKGTQTFLLHGCDTVVSCHLSCYSKKASGRDPSRRCCLVIMREGTPRPLYPGSDFSMLRSLSKHQFRSGGMWREGQGCIRIRAPIPARAPAPAQAPAGRIAPVAAPRGAAAPVEAQAGFHLAR